MVTVIRQPHRTLTIAHDDNLEVRDVSNTAIVVSYKDYCNTCEPQLFEIQSEKDLYIELYTRNPPL